MRALRGFRNGLVCAGAVALLSSVTLNEGQAQGQANDAKVEQPRAYGHVLGDVLTQRVSLEDAAGHAEVPVLPAVARVNAWFDRLPPHVETDDTGHAWLRLDYQVVNVSRDLELAALPALTLALKSGNTLRVPEWPVSVGPLTPDVVFDKGDHTPTRPDQAAKPYPTELVRRDLQRWAGLLGLTLLAWLGWLVGRNAHDATRLPFARAARTVRRAAAPEASEGWVALHRAFNDTAGRVVQPESLPTLFERAPFLVPLRPDIEQFFAASSERFFARTPGAALIRLEPFSRALKQAEKRKGSRRGA